LAAKLARLKTGPTAGPRARWFAVTQGPDYRWADPRAPGSPARDLAAPRVRRAGLPAAAPARDTGIVLSLRQALAAGLRGPGCSPAALPVWLIPR